MEDKLRGGVTLDLDHIHGWRLRGGATLDLDHIHGWRLRGVQPLTWSINMDGG